jgi:AP-2 complex subunit alpha
MHITGWPVDIGYSEAIALASSHKYHEKRMGYLAISLLPMDKCDEDVGVYESIDGALGSAKETDVCLALSAISNIDSGLALQFVDRVVSLLADKEASSFVKKKACLCLLSILRKSSADKKLKEWAGISPSFYC